MIIRFATTAEELRRGVNPYPVAEVAFYDPVAMEARNARRCFGSSARPTDLPVRDWINGDDQTTPVDPDLVCDFGGS